MTTTTRTRSLVAGLAVAALPLLPVPHAAAAADHAATSATSATAPSSCHRTLARYPILRPGDRGPAVRTLQCALNDLGRTLVVDGYYGPATRRVVRGIESEFEGPPAHPGRIGNGFWTLLYGGQLPDRVLGAGDHGHAVTVLQRALRAAGGDVVVDGDFGPQTRRVVRAYQRAHGLGHSGRLTHDTRFILAMGGVFGRLT